jgi:hypothetical protein
MRGITISALAGALSLAALTRLPSALLYNARRQPSTVTITVIDAGAGFPLANADVIELPSGRHHFTDEHGQARLPWPSDGQVRVRVREVGYKPDERTLDRASLSADATTFALSKVAYVITPVKATSHCVTTADSASLATSVAVLDQIQQGAEKYNEFRRLYPFEASVDRRTAAIPTRGPVKRVVEAKEKFRSENWETAYRPGDVVQYNFDGSFLAPVLFLSTLGDSVFWEHHCFVARGIESFQGTRVIRLDFSPSSDVHGPDWEGSALLDSATSFLLHLDFHLANLDLGKGLTRLDGYQTFTSPSPFVIIPDSVMAVWWTRGKTFEGEPSWGNPDYAQSLHVDSLKYRKAKPPEYPAARQ